MGSPFKIAKTLKAAPLTHPAQKIKKICNIPVTISPHKTLNSSKGVVKHTDLKGTTQQEMITELKHEGVTDANNIQITREGKVIPTNTWILTFDTPTPPQQIKIPGYMSLQVRPYIPKPMRCTNCHRLGHTKNRCRTGHKCEYCGGYPSDDSHDDPEQICPHLDTGGWCPNCKVAGHVSGDIKICPKYRNQRYP